MSPLHKDTWNRIIAGYYLATPLFAAVDLVANAPVRAAGLSSPEWRMGYYVILLGLGFVCRVRPGWAPVVGMAESSVNLLLLILSIMLPIWGMADQVLSGGPVADVARGPQLANFALSGAMAILAFKRNERALHRRLSRDRP